MQSSMDHIWHQLLSYEDEQLYEEAPWKSCYNCYYIKEDHPIVHVCLKSYWFNQNRSMVGVLNDIYLVGYVSS